MKVEYRAYIKIRVKLGDNSTSIHDDLKRVYGHDAPSYHTVADWAARFRDGRETIEDDQRSGRPVSTCTPENIERVRKLIEDDGRITVEDIATLVGISLGSAQTILKEHLQMRKLCARWVPHILTEEQKEERVEVAEYLLQKYEGCDERRLKEIVTGDETWVHFFDNETKEKNKVWVDKDGKTPTIVRRCVSTEKELYIIFFNAHM